MFYGFLADVLGLIHFGYVGFVFFGQLLILAGIGLRWRWIRNLKFRVLHLVMILIVALESVGGLMCPLTTWEKNLRVRAGQPAGGDSFVADLLNNTMFCNGLEIDHWFWKSAYVSFAALVVMTFILAPPGRRFQTPTALEVNRGFVATALLATLAFIFVYTALSMNDYQKYWHEEDPLPLYFLAFSGIHFAGLALLCWALRLGK